VSSPFDYAASFSHLPSASAVAEPDRDPHRKRSSAAAFDLRVFDQPGSSPLQYSNVRLLDIDALRPLGRTASQVAGARSSPPWPKVIVTSLFLFRYHFFTNTLVLVPLSEMLLLPLDAAQPNPTPFLPTRAGGFFPPDIWATKICAILAWVARHRPFPLKNI